MNYFVASKLDLGSFSLMVLLLRFPPYHFAWKMFAFSTLSLDYGVCNACRFCMPLATGAGCLEIVLGVVVAGFNWSTAKGFLPNWQNLVSLD